MGLMIAGVHDRFQVALVKRLLAKGVEVACLVGTQLKAQDFPGIKLFEHSALMNPKFYEEANARSPYALSEHLIQECQEYEGIFLKNSDRFALFNVSVRRRTMIYQDMLLFWYGFLKENKIDAILFEATPHMGWDTVLYGLARKFSIDAFYIERTSIDDTVLFVDDYRQMPRVPADFLSDKNREELISLLGESFYREVFKESYWIKRTKNLLEEAATKKVLRRRVASFFHLLRYSFQVRRTQEEEWLTAFALNFPVTRAINALLLQMVKWRDRSLLRYYSRLIQPIRYDEKYVFFPLQFQPERTSIPLGGIFENQVLALRILSQAIPAGWKIYVKEHPRQLKCSRMDSVHYRSKKYYQLLNSIVNVVLVDLDIENETLVEHAQITAVLTGSSGWESILKGKACLVFGYPWYVGCRSAFRVHSVENCREAIKQILHKTKEDVESDLLRFLLYYERQFVISSTSDLFASQSAGDYDVLVENLAEAVKAKVSAEEASLVRGQDYFLTRETR